MQLDKYNAHRDAPVTNGKRTEIVVLRQQNALAVDGLLKDGDVVNCRRTFGRIFNVTSSRTQRADKRPGYASIGQQSHSFGGDQTFARNDGCRICKGGVKIGFLKPAVVSQQLLSCLAGSQLPQEEVNGNTCIANARLAGHYSRVLGNARMRGARHS